MQRIHLPPTHLLSRLGWPLFVLAVGVQLLGALLRQRTMAFWPGQSELALTLANLIVVIGLIRTALTLCGRWDAREPVRSRRELWLGAAVVLCAEALISAIGYGRIDVLVGVAALVAVLILSDLIWAGSSRWERGRGGRPARRAHP